MNKLKRTTDKLPGLGGRQLLWLLPTLAFWSRPDVSPLTGPILLGGLVPASGLLCLLGFGLNGLAPLYALYLSFLGLGIFERVIRGGIKRRRANFAISPAEMNIFSLGSSK